MSGSGGKSKSQVTLPQKGKSTTTCCTTTEEGQDRGKTRTTALWEINDDNQEICDSQKGRSFLKEKLLFVPSGAPLTLGALATTIFQVLYMQGLGRQAVNVVQAVAYLLQEVEISEVTESIRDITNEQFNEVTRDLREFTESLREVDRGSREEDGRAGEEDGGAHRSGRKGSSAGR